MLPNENEFQFASVSDAESIGEMAARKAIELLGVETAGNGKKTILQILGDPGDSYSLRVLGGFRATMRSAPRIDVITVPAMDWEPQNARKIAEQLQQSKQRVDLVFAHSADLAAAVIPLFKEDIDSGKLNVMAITGAPVGLENVAEGLQKYEIEQPTYAQVYGLALGLRNVFDRAMGKAALRDGPCNLMGIKGRLEGNGKVLKLEGRPLEASDLRDPGARAKLGLWGDLARPMKTADEINALACEGS